MTPFSHPCCPAYARMGSNMGLGSATEVKKFICCPDVEADNVLPCLNKRKRQKEREEKSCPTWGWKERLQLNVWVRLTLILLRLEGYMHVTRAAVAIRCRQLIMCSVSPSKTQPFFLLITPLPFSPRMLLPVCLLLGFVARGSSASWVLLMLTDMMRVYVLLRAPLNIAIRGLLKQAT